MECTEEEGRKSVRILEIGVYLVRNHWNDYNLQHIWFMIDNRIEIEIRMGLKY